MSVKRVQRGWLRAVHWIVAGAGFHALGWIVTIALYLKPRIIPEEIYPGAPAASAFKRARGAVAGGFLWESDLAHARSDFPNATAGRRSRPSTAQG